MKKTKIILIVCGVIAIASLIVYLLVFQKPLNSTATETNTKPLTITFINHCGVDIGMISVIDPVTKEQVNVDPIPADDSVTLEAQWPIGITEFSWALYNQDGELYMEGKTDLSSVQSSATITLSGNQSVETIEESFE